MSGANRQKPPRKRDATAADRNALCRALVEAGIVRLVVYANKTLAEKKAISRFGTFLVIARGDVDRAVELLRKQSPADVEYLPLLQKTWIAGRIPGSRL